MPAAFVEGDSADNMKNDDRPKPNDDPSLPDKSGRKPSRLPQFGIMTMLGLTCGAAGLFALWHYTGPFYAVRLFVAAAVYFSMRTIANVYKSLTCAGLVLLVTICLTPRVGTVTPRARREEPRRGSALASCAVSASSSRAGRYRIG